MKKIMSFLLVMMSMYLGLNAQPATPAATPPTRSASDVIALYSGAYTEVSGTNWSPYWGQSTPVTVSDVSIGGNATKHYETLSYIGVELASPINVSGMQNLHLDLWTTNCTSFEVSLITPGVGENGYSITPTASGWTSVDIPLTNYTVPNLSNIAQLKFVGQPFGSSDVYVDNIYFWKAANAPSLSNFSIPAKVLGNAPFTITAPTSNSTGAFSYTSSNTSVATVSGNTITLTGVGTTTITATQAAAGSYGSGTIQATLVVSSPPPATAAPTPPVRSAGNVISMFSDAYSNVSIDTWSAVWDQADLTDELIGSNNNKKYTNLNFAGVEFTSSPINATNMERFHMDVWTPDATVFKIKLVDFGANGSFGGGDDVEQELGYTPTLSGWNSYDIALSDFTGLVTRGHLAQMILVASNSTVYIDNVYFWRSAPAPTFGAFNVPAKTVGAAAFNLTAPTSNSTGAFSYTSSNLNVATISGSTVTIIGAGTSVITATQAAAGSFGSGSTTANLVVTGPAAPTTAAPTPPSRNASDVISLYSNSYTNVSGIDWFPNWGQNAFCQDTTIAGNATHIYPNLNYHGVQFASNIDASSMTKLHVDIWTADCSAFDFYLINTNVGLERKITINPPFAGWRSYDIDLTQFSSQGVDLANIGQFKFVSTPFGGTKVYMDNVYFWKPNNVPTISNFYVPGKYLGDPNFTLTTPTSNSTGAFTYSSSNTAVATISGNVVTIVGVGSTTITATQAAAAPLLSGSITTVLNVDFAPPTSAAPTPPVRNAGDVISLYSDAYTNSPVDTWSAVWDQANVSDATIASNNNKKYTNLVFAGIEFTSNTVDASAMQFFHIDAWTPNATTFNIKLVDFGDNGVYGGGDDVEQELSYTPTLSSWNSYDIPMSSFAGLTTRAHLAQMIIVASNSTVYLDNVYFYKGTALSPTVAITQPTCSVATGTITITSPTTGLTFSKDGVAYQSSNIFSGLAVGTYSITSKTSSGVVSSPVSAVVRSTTPPAPAGITGIKNVSKCDSIQTYSVVSPVYGYTYTWSVSGAGNSIKAGQGSSSADIAINVAGTVSVKATRCVLAGPVVSYAVLKATPTAPAAIYAGTSGVTSPSTNLCMYTQSAVASTGVKDTLRIRQVLNATGYYFTVPGGATMQRLNDTTITVVFADTTSAGATVKAYTLSNCDTSLAKALTMVRTLAATPSGIYASFTAGSTTGPAAVTAVCSIVGGASTTYKIRKVATALNYAWSVKSGANMIVTHENEEGSINDTAISVQYLSGFVRDSIFVRSINGCGIGVAKAVAVVASRPATPARIVATLVDNSCGARIYRYVAPDLTAASSTASAATGYLWTLAAGAVGSTGVLDSGTLTSKVIRVRYSSNAAALAGDSIKVAYASTCGYSAYKALKLSNAVLNVPAAPTSLAITSLGASVCGRPRYRYAAPTTLPLATTTAGAATGWQWSFYGTLGATFVVDSGSLTSRVVTGYFTSTAARAAGDSVKVRYSSACGFSLYRVAALSNVASSSNPPAVPSSLTATLVEDVCGARIYRYTAPVLPVGTATNAAATGYQWSLPTGSSVALSATLDSGVLSGPGARFIRLKFTNNGAAVTGDSVRVRFTSACGVGNNKALKLTNVAKACSNGGSVFSKSENLNEAIKAEIFPNPNNGNFTLSVQTGIVTSSIAKVQIIDMYGRVVNQFTTQNNNGTIYTNISDAKLVNGLYSVRYSIGTYSNSIKMVIKK
jgi:hypothetical protein